MRLDGRVESEMVRLLHGTERPRLAVVREKLLRFCDRHQLRAPSRATIYNFIDRCPDHHYSIAELPGYVRDALYNLDPNDSVPGHQLAFYAFQYGDNRAACFAAGLPWIDLHQANRMRGWRPRTIGLLRAVMRRRGIP